MKGVVALLLLVAVAVQGRSSVLESSLTGNEVVPSASTDPWVVHLRIAVATSGFLNTCGGSLVSRRHVFTTAACILDSRFIWVRLGATNVWNPEEVVETSTYMFHPDFDPNTFRCNAGLVDLNREIVFTPTISPIRVETIEQMYDEFNDARFCGYPTDDDDTPGTDLQCFDVNCMVPAGNRTTCSCDIASRFDTGAPLVRKGLQVGFMLRLEDELTVFRRIGSFEEWVSDVTRFFV